MVAFNQRSRHALVAKQEEGNQGGGGGDTDRMQTTADRLSRLAPKVIRGQMPRGATRSIGLDPSLNSPKEKTLVQEGIPLPIPNLASLA